MMTPFGHINRKVVKLDDYLIGRADVAPQEDKQIVKKKCRKKLGQKK